tara:strand:+ start:563 stop:1309 length:747 start_codon:yes stop_codon:yes gene_type:complete
MAGHIFISHNHNDFGGFMRYLIAKSSGYVDTSNDSAINRYIKWNNNITSPYKDQDAACEELSATSWTSLANKVSYLSTCEIDIDNQYSSPPTDTAFTNVDNLVHTLLGDSSNALYGDCFTNSFLDTVDTTLYDSVIAASGKVIHVTWDDFTHTSFTTTYKQRIIDANTSGNYGSVSDWDERLSHYKRNLEELKTQYPTTSSDFTLYQDKILDKDATHYGDLCTFLGVTALSDSTWHGYVDNFNTHLSS